MGEQHLPLLCPLPQRGLTIMGNVRDHPPLFGCSCFYKQKKLSKDVAVLFLRAALPLYVSSEVLKTIMIKN